MVYKLDGLPSDLLSSDKEEARALKTALFDPATGAVLNLTNGALPVTTSTNPLGVDAWGRNKVISDFSMSHGIWTFEVQNQKFKEYHNGVKQPTIDSFVSENGMLKGTGGVGKHELRSKRHARYQPNRGLLYSNSCFVPDSLANPTTEYDWGVFTSQSGIFFRLLNNVLYACRRTLFNGVVSETVEQITTLPAGYDPTKGNIYDIQMQWRGVGGIKFFVNQLLCHEFDLLGTLSAISVFNPAMPIAYAINGAGTLYSGCADVSSEGGFREDLQYNAIDSGDVTIPTSEVAAMAIYMPDLINYNGTNVDNTRDNILNRITGTHENNSVMRVYFTDNVTFFNNPTAWTSNDQIGNMRYAIGEANIISGTSSLAALIAGSKKLATRRILADDSKEITNPDAGREDFFLTHGDFIVVTLQARTSGLGSVDIEYGSEI